MGSRLRRSAGWACVLLVCVAACGAQPAVTVQASAVPNVTLIGPKDKGFAEAVTAVVGEKRPDGVAQWLPFAVIVKNAGKEAVAGWTLVWRGANDAAAPLEMIRAMASTAGFTAPEWQIAPGQSFVVLPGAVLRNPKDLTAFARNPGAPESLAHRQRVEVTLDAVAFESGQFAGPNLTGAYQLYLAEIDAPRAVATALMEKRTMLPIADVLAWLKKIADAKVEANSEPGREAAEARQLLASYERRGEKGLYARADSVLAAPPFPLHR